MAQAPPAGPPEPASAISSERFRGAIGEEYLDADAAPRVEVEERLEACALSEVGRADPRYHHAALSAGSARAKPRR